MIKAYYVPILDTEYQIMQAGKRREVNPDPVQDPSPSRPSLTQNALYGPPRDLSVDNVRIAVRPRYVGSLLVSLATALGGVLLLAMYAFVVAGVPIHIIPISVQVPMYPRVSIGWGVVVPLMVFLARRHPDERRSRAVMKGASAGIVLTLVNGLAVVLIDVVMFGGLDRALLALSYVSGAVPVLSRIVHLTTTGFLLSLGVLAVAGVVALITKRRGS